MNGDFFELKVFKIMPDLTKIECGIDDFDITLHQIRMSDDSMIRASISKGDILCFSKSNNFEDGDFVICMIDEIYKLRQYRVLSDSKIDLVSYGLSTEHHVVNKQGTDIIGKLSYVMEMGKALDVDDLLDPDKPKVIN